MTHFSESVIVNDLPFPRCDSGVQSEVELVIVTHIYGFMVLIYLQYMVT